MMRIAIRAARPGQRRLVSLCAPLAGVTTGLAAQVPERIPAGARVVTVTPASGFGSSPGRGEPGDAVTDPATVATIAAVTGGPGQLPDGTCSCPAGAGTAVMLTAMQLTSGTAPGGPVAATVSAGYAGCQLAWVTAGAQTVWPPGENTGSGQPVPQQVLAIAGVRWPYPPG